MNYKKKIINVLVSIFLFLLFVICCTTSFYLLRGGFRNVIYGMLSTIPMLIGILLLVYGWARIRNLKKIAILSLSIIILLVVVSTLGFLSSIKMRKLCPSLSSKECKKNFMCVSKIYETSSCPVCMDVIYRTKCISVLRTRNNKSEFPSSYLIR